MKTTAILTATLGLALGTLHAQTPLFINYQGKVTDSAGVGLGTGTPVNRKVIFRIYDAATAGTKLWTEEQTVTISNGEFSVLLGLGIPATGTAAGEARPAIDTVFTSSGSSRYLGITVDNGDNVINGSDVEITPRQQITSTAYSFRARSADTIVNGTDLQLNGSANYGLGYYGSGRLFNGTAIDGPVLYGAGGGALGVVSGATQTPVLRWNSSGNVGIGTTTPTQRLTVANNGDYQTQFKVTSDSIGGTGILIANTAANGHEWALISTNTGLGGGVGPGDFGIFDQTASRYGLLISGATGNVGIGTTGPSDKLEVVGNIRLSNGGVPMYNGSGNGGTRAMTTTVLTNEIHGSSGGGLDAGQLRLSAGGDSSIAHKTAIDLYGYDTNDMRFYTNGTERMRVANGGNVGIGTTAPSTKLEVAGTVTATAFVGNGAGLTGLPANPWSTVAGGLSYSGGNVGIGKANPGFNLHLSDALGEKLCLNGNAGGPIYGFGIQSLTLQVLSQGNTTFGSGTSAAMTEFMRINNAGNVGIGTTAPSNKLTVSGNADFTGNVGIGTTAPANKLTVAGNADFTGSVGIGTAAPGAPLHVAGGAALGAFYRQAQVQPDGTGDVDEPNFNASTSTTGGSTHSIISEFRIRASALDVTNTLTASDERIKRIVGPSGGAKDLQTLLRLQVTDYGYIDTVTHGNAPQKKVIAQQVETVYPQAVNKATDVVPDIYQKATVKDGWVTLATNLKKGERVRLVGEKEQGIHEVLEVRDGAFRTAFKPSTEKVFVYGREVKDFRSVDYEAIAMLNVSATQQLKKEKDAEVKALQQENSELRNRLAALEAKDKARDAKLASIEKLLTSPDRPATRTISLKQGK